MLPESDSRRPPQSRRGPAWTRLLGDVLLLAGVVSLLLAGYTYFADSSRDDLSLPRPVALADEPEATSTPVPATATPIPASPEPTKPLATSGPTSTPTVTPTATATPIPAGVPVRMVIPSIRLDSRVEEVGMVRKNGELIWETIPHIVGHYGTSAKAGEKGNSIFSGHVASRNWGNVFINLYKIEIGDEIQVRTDDAVFTYAVNRVRLVLPTQTDVMNQTPEATLTVITCGGDWLADREDYSHRLVVTAKLKSAKPRS